MRYITIIFILFKIIKLCELSGDSNLNVGHC